MSVLANPDPDAFGSPDSASTTIVKTEYDDTFDSMMFRYSARETFPAEHRCKATIPYHPVPNIPVTCTMTRNPHSSLSAVQHVATKYSTLDEPRLHSHYLNPIMASSHQPLFQGEEVGLAFDNSAEESVYPIRQSIEKDNELPFGDASTPAIELWTWTGYVKHPESSERSSLRREAERLRETRGEHVASVARSARIRVQDS